jgi:hypothetical protein
MAEENSQEQKALEALSKLVKGSEFEGKTLLKYDKSHVAHRAAVKFLQSGS